MKPKVAASMKALLTTSLAFVALAAPALGQGYPVSGQWGQSTSSDKGAIDCTNRRVFDFKNDQRTDSKGGVPAYRNKSVTATAPSRYRVVDTFTTGQIRNGSLSYTLQQIDADHIELNMQPGGVVKLQKCK
jgi:hypothetical protein